MSLPVVDYLKLPEGEDPYLEGHKCKDCGSIFLGERNVCSNCFALAVFNYDCYSCVFVS